MLARKNTPALIALLVTNERGKSDITLTTGEGLETGHHHEEAGRGSGILFKTFSLILMNGPVSKSVTLHRA
jgi:hypothetical protein